uniref:Uncharacterized protein n=1 Tax=Ixodes ricinus TaxID=34613 RepID=A0A147BWA2_IXORI
MRPIFLSASSNSRNACSRKGGKLEKKKTRKKKVPRIFFCFFFYFFFCKGVRKYISRNSNVRSWKSISYILCTSRKEKFCAKSLRNTFFFLHLCVSIPIQNSRIMYTLKLRRLFFFSPMRPRVCEKVVWFVPFKVQRRVRRPNMKQQ